MVGEVAAEEEAFEVGLQEVGGRDQLHRGDADEIAPVSLVPRHLHLGQRLELAAEAAVLHPRALGDAALLAELAGEEGDDPVAVVQIPDVEDQRLGGLQAHLPHPSTALPSRRMALIEAKTPNATPNSAEDPNGDLGFGVVV